MISRRTFLLSGVGTLLLSGDTLAHETRLEYELELLEKHRLLRPMKWAAELCRRHPPAPGVGAVAGSLVAYRLGLTRIDPILHGLYFERFLNSRLSRRPTIFLAAGARTVGQVSEPWSDSDPVLLAPDVEAWGLGVLDRPGREIVDYLDIFDSKKIGCREFLRHLRPRSLEDYAVAIALYRPGALEIGTVDAYLDRKAGREEWRAEEPLLGPILDETYGLWIYQEQVMRAALEIAGFSVADADILRRAACRKQPDEMARWRKRFANDRLFDEIEFSGPQTFLKAHAIAWADMAMRAAGGLPRTEEYLRCP